MSHRVKNLLAIATGLTTITLRSTTTSVDIAHELTQRLTALERAHDRMPDHPAEGPCRALEHAEGRFVCGLIRHASRYLPELPNDWADAHLGGQFAEALGSGGISRGSWIS